MPGSGKRSPGVGERGRRGAGVTRVSLMGWKLCGDKKERGLVLPRDRLPRGMIEGKKGLDGRNINISYCVQTYSRSGNKLKIPRDTLVNTRGETVYVMHS